LHKSDRSQGTLSGKKQRPDKGFVMVPDEVRFDRSLSNAAMRVYMVLAAQTRETKSQRCAPIGIRLIAKLAFCSRATVTETLKRLVEKKYLSVEGGTRGYRSTYVMASKWFIPKEQRAGAKEETVYQDAAVKVVKKKGKGTYTPRQYSLKEETA
jgi:hypothetical protein